MMHRRAYSPNEIAHPGSPDHTPLTDLVSTEPCATLLLCLANGSIIGAEAADVQDGGLTNASTGHGSAVNMTMKSGIGDIVHHFARTVKSNFLFGTWHCLLLFTLP
jgi:hypothetical protein